MAKPGDKVRIKTKDAIYEGILMPQSAKLSEDSFVIKLKNGYNVGISKKKIISFEVTHQYKPEKREPKKLVHKKGLPDIALLSTGGTISSKVNYKTGGVSPVLDASDFVENVPEISNIANLEFKQVAQELSENITPNLWIKLANEIHKKIKDGKKGIIVTHGTDTMHYTSAAISFMIQNLPVPIVFIGAQRSIDRGSSDAFPNLLAAVYAASKWDGAETVICMHESMNDTANILVRGTKARKMHTERRDAFKPVNDVPLARIDYKGNILRTAKYKLRDEKLTPILNTKIDNKVALIYVYPGINPKIIDYYIEKGYHGIVLAGTGMGHTPHSLFPAIKRCARAGIPVAMTSQCIFGRVNPRVYETARILESECHVIYLEDMTPETALVKMMFVLGQTRDIKKVRKMLLTNIAGEITERTTPMAFI